MAVRYPRSKAFERFALGALSLCVGGMLTVAALGWSPALTLSRGTVIEEHAETASIEDESLTAFAPPEVTDADRRSTRNLRKAFDRMGYDLTAIGEGWGDVPRVTLTSLPKDFSRDTAEEVRKDIFIRAMLPLILRVNESIRIERDHLLALRARVKAGEPLSAQEQLWLKDLAERYGQPSARNLAALLRKVDEVPVSLALAQAIEESGWGTSGVTRNGNSLFGHLTFTDGAPRVRTFDSLQEAVEAYVRNLNTHRAYEGFRRDRAALRARGGVLDGMALAGTLDAYSERGGAYVAGLRAIMRDNGLHRYDTARLTPTDEPQSAMLVSAEGELRQAN